MNLSNLGWNQNFDSQFAQYRPESLVPARIAAEHKSSYIILGEDGEFAAEIAGRFRFDAESRSQFPAVGDWAAVSVRRDEGRATIHAILSRKSAFVRKAAGIETVEQVVAANIDTVFIITGLDANYNLRRIERYLALAWESGAIPVVVLNKADLCDKTELRISEVASVAIGVTICAMSAATRAGLDTLNQFLTRGKTCAFLGSSGVGKSSIINALLGEDRLATADVREEDSRGRHTTTSRELIILPQGGLVIDTPGMRELQVWGDEEGLKQAFDDVEALAANCRFRDCGHEAEPGCAVRAAIDNGELAYERYQNYLKLKRELAYLARRQVMKANAVEKLRWRQIAMFQKSLKKSK